MPWDYTNFPPNYVPPLPTTRKSVRGELFSRDTYTEEVISYEYDPSTMKMSQVKGWVDGGSGLIVDVKTR